MQQILKLQQGRSVSKKEAKQIKTQFEQAYATATPELKAQIDKMMSDGHQFSQANLMNNRSQREFDTYLYENGLSIINGTYNITPNPTVTSRNIFGGYTHNEGAANAQHVTNLALSSPVKDRLKGDSRYYANDDAHSNEIARYRFKWNASLGGSDPLLGLETDSFESRYKGFIDILKNSVILAKNAKEEGKQLSGLGTYQNNIDQLTADLDALYNLPSTKSKEESLTALLRVLKGLGGISQADFNTFFEGYMPKVTEAAKRKKALEEEGYKFIDNVNSGNTDFDNFAKNYSIATKDGKNYIFKKDYSGFADSTTKINSNNTQDTFGYGYHIGSDGSYFVGNLLDTGIENPYREAIDKYINESVKTRNDKKWWKDELDTKFNYLTDFGEGDNNLIDTFSSKLNGKRIVDVSGYFGGAPAIATFKDNDISSHIDALGGINLKDATIYLLTANGPKEFTFDQLASNNIIMNFDDANTYGGAGKYEPNGSTFDMWRELNEDERTMDLNGKTGFRNFMHGGSEIINPWTGEKLDSHRDIVGDDNSLDASGRMLLTVLAAGPSVFKSKDDQEDAKYILQDYITSNPWQAAKIMYTYLKSGTLEADFGAENAAKILKAWRLFVAHNKTRLQPTEITVEKQGGILKAASGTLVNAYGETPYKDIRSSIEKEADTKFKDLDALKKRADANGYDIGKQSAIESGKWTRSDTLRATALATDVVGLIGAMTSAATGGIGSGIAIGSGFASMGLDAAADFTDDKVSAGQAWKNLGINAGLAVGAAFGANAPKLIKGVMKMVPKAMMAIGAAGIALDPEVHKTVSKISSGKSLNINDWRNIALVLRTATGIGTVHATSRGAKKYVKKAQAELNAKLKEKVTINGDKVTLTSEDGTITKEIDKTLYNQIKSALDPKGKTTEQYQQSVDAITNKLKTDHGFDDSAISALILDTKNKRGLNPFTKGFWKPGTSKEVKLAGDDALLKNVPDEVKANVYQELLANERSKIGANGRIKPTNKFTKLMSKLDVGVEKLSFGKIKQENYMLNGLSAAISEIQGKNMDLSAIDTWIKQNRSLIDSFDLNSFNHNAYKQNMQSAWATRDQAVLAAQDQVDLRQQDLDVVRQNAKKALDEVEAVELRLKDVTTQIKNLNRKGKAADIKSLRQLVNDLNDELAAKMAEVVKLRNKFGTDGEFNAMKSFIKIIKDFDTYKLNNSSFFNPNGTLSNEGRKSAEARLLYKDYKTAKSLVTLDNIANFDKYTEALNLRAILELNLTTNRNLLGQKELDYNKLKKSDFHLRNLRRNILAGNYNLKTGKITTTLLYDYNALQQSAKDYRYTFDDKIKDPNNPGKFIIIHSKGEHKISNLEKNAEARLNAMLDNLKTVKNDLKALVHDAAISTIAKQTQKVGTTSREFTLDLASGTSITIPAGSKVNSYAHVRNEVLAKQAAEKAVTRANKNDVITELTAEEAQHFVHPSNKANIRGGYYNTKTKKITLFEPGGSINNKYSHLRK